MDPFPAMLAAYLALIAALALHGLRSVRTPAQFLVAGRRSSGLLVGGSLAATILGGSNTVGLAAQAYRLGLAGSWWLLVGALGLAGLLFFIRPLRTHPVYTLPQLIGLWYGPLMRRVAAGFIAAAWLGVVGAQAGAAGTVLAAFLGGSVRLWTLGVGAVFILYTAAGGQVSVMHTDLAQLVLVLAGIGACAFIGLQRAGGFAGLSDALRGPLGGEALAFPVSGLFGPVDLGLLLLVVGSTYLIGPDMLSRVFCSRSDRAARRGILLSIGVIVPFALIVALAGMVSRALLPAAGPEASLARLALTVLPDALAALCLLALLSAFLSSADTTLLTLAAVLSLDLPRPSSPTSAAIEGASPRMAALRLTVLGAGAAAVAIGVFSGGVIPSLLLGYSVFSGGLFVPILAGLSGKPLGPRAALAATALGGTLALSGRLAGSDALLAAAFIASTLILVWDRLRRNGPRRTGNR